MQDWQKWTRISGVEFPLETRYPRLSIVSPVDLAKELLESLPILTEWISLVWNCVSKQDWENVEESFKKKHPTDHAGLRAITSWAISKIINSDYRVHSISPTGVLRLYPVTVSRGYGYDFGDGQVTEKEIKALERYIGDIPPKVKKILSEHNTKKEYDNAL